MSVLSWGMNRPFIKDLDATSPKWEEMPTPAEDSTELSTEDGEKMEAPLEGGQNEDVKYKDAKYQFKYDIRNAKGKGIPIQHINGNPEGNHHYAVCNLPEDTSTPGIYMPKTSVACNTTHTQSEGTKTTYTHESLKPDTGKYQMQLGKLEVDDTDKTDISIKFYPLQKDGTYSSTAVEI